MRGMSDMAKPDVYEIVTDRIIKRLEDGVVPWKMGWDSKMGIPRNLRGTKYRGVNIIILSMEATANGYEHPIWMTYKQASEAGGQVRKGEKSTPVIFWKVIEKEVENDFGEVEIEKSFFLRYYSVFNIAQVDGIEPPKDDAKTIETPHVDEVISGYKGCPPIKFGGGRAAYSPGLDEIYMPPVKAFNGPEEYASTIFHEMVHSTGHEKRLNRKIQNSFGDEDYSKEELVAEIGSAFLCSHIGVEKVLDNQAAYIDGWLKAFKGDKKMVVHAAGAAQRAVDYIIKEE